MKDINIILEKNRNNIESIFSKEYKTTFYKKKKIGIVLKVAGFWFLPIKIIFGMIMAWVVKLMKMRIIGRPFRMLKAIIFILTWVKRVEELERKLLVLEKEHTSLKRQWFNS